MLKAHGSAGVSKSKNVVTKKLRTRKSFDNELSIYKQGLPYTPKLISSNEDDLTIKISYECCKALIQLPLDERDKYYPAVKKLFNRLYKDTGFYHNDFSAKNIIVNEKTGKLYLIDFSSLKTDKDDLSLETRTFLKKLNNTNTNPRVHKRYI